MRIKNRQLVVEVPEGMFEAFDSLAQRNSRTRRGELLIALEQYLLINRVNYVRDPDAEIDHRKRRT